MDNLIDQNLADQMCRTVAATIEMFPHATRVEIVTNTLDEEGRLNGALIISATRNSYDEKPVIGLELRRSDVWGWNKDASDTELFGSVE